jgi:hypothetical protein
MAQELLVGRLTTCYEERERKERKGPSPLSSLHQKKGGASHYNSQITVTRTFMGALNPTSFCGIRTAFLITNL